PLPPPSTRFPYTTLFRSAGIHIEPELGRGDEVRVRARDVDAVGLQRGRSTHLDHVPPGLGLEPAREIVGEARGDVLADGDGSGEDRKSTRLNSSHSQISY